MRVNEIQNVGLSTGVVGLSTSASVLVITPDMILTYLSIFCMVISMVSTLILTAFKIYTAMKNKKYKEAGDILKETAEDVSEKSNEILEKIESSKEVKK